MPKVKRIHNENNVKETVKMTDNQIIIINDMNEVIAYGKYRNDVIMDAVRIIEQQYDIDNSSESISITDNNIFIIRSSGFLSSEIAKVFAIISVNCKYEQGDYILISSTMDNKIKILNVKKNYTEVKNELLRYINNKYSLNAENNYRNNKIFIPGEEEDPDEATYFTIYENDDILEIAEELFIIH